MSAGLRQPLGVPTTHPLCPTRTTLTCYWEVFLGASLWRYHLSVHSVTQSFSLAHWTGNILGVSSSPQNSWRGGAVSAGSSLSSLCSSSLPPVSYIWFQGDGLRRDPSGRWTDHAVPGRPLGLFSHFLKDVATDPPCLDASFHWNLQSGFFFSPLHFYHINCKQNSFIKWDSSLIINWFPRGIVHKGTAR